MLGELLGEVGAGEWHLRNKAHPDQGHPAGVYNGEVPSGCRGLENLESPRARGGRPRVGDSAFSGDEERECSGVRSTGWFERRQLLVAMPSYDTRASLPQIPAAGERGVTSDGMTSLPTEARKNGPWPGKVFGIPWLGRYNARLSFLPSPVPRIEAIFQPSDSMSSC